MTFNPDFSISLPLVRVEGVEQRPRGKPSWPLLFGLRVRAGLVDPISTRWMPKNESQQILDQPVSGGVGCRLGPVGDVGLVEDIAHVAGNSPHANE